MDWAVKQQWSNWDRLTASSLLCSKHFETTEAQYTIFSPYKCVLIYSYVYNHDYECCHGNMSGRCLIDNFPCSKSILSDHFWLWPHAWGPIENEALHVCYKPTWETTHLFIILISYQLVLLIRSMLWMESSVLGQTIFSGKSSSKLKAYRFEHIRPYFDPNG